MVYVATYALYIDWDNDGSFATAGDDVTDDFMAATITRGFSSPLARVAQTGRATFVLLNTSQAYSPPLDATVLPRRPVKFDMSYGGTTETLFRGFIQSISPDSGQHGRRRVTIECVDAMALLDQFEGEIQLQTNVYADDVINDVVNAVYTPPSTNYQEGINLFPTSAEGWSHEGDNAEQIRASQKIQEVCSSDWGRFFIAKNGAATFYNRHQMPLDGTTELTIINIMLGMSYRKDVASVFNYVEVACYPRTIGTRNEVLARLSQADAPTIEASDSRTFVLRFRDPSNQKIKVGGKDCITPVAGTDFNVTSDPQGLGANENGNITPSATFYGDHAEVTLTNGAAYPVYVQLLQVRGLAVRARERVTMMAQDATSIAAYQKRRLPINAPLMSQQAEAQLLADYLLDYYKDPLNEVGGVEISANKYTTWLDAARDLELMDRVVLTESQVGLSSYAGHVSRMTHNIRMGGRSHRMTFDLETAYTITGTPFALDTSALNSGHVLIY